jgi:hypothetical protein
MSVINDVTMEALDDALRVGNIDLYNQIKEEC